MDDITSKSKVPPERETLNCPSFRCKPGANLLGIVLPTGRISYLGEKMIVDERFVEIARQGRAPEKRFRFSSSCVRGECGQWANERCTVIGRLLEQLKPLDEHAALPKCSIRPDCRWFSQDGPRACRICPDIVTDNSERIDNRIT